MKASKPLVVVVLICAGLVLLALMVWCCVCGARLFAQWQYEASRPPVQHQDDQRP